MGGVDITHMSQVEIINAEINRELSNKEVGAALLATTFKGLTAVTMKQALMEGMIRGYKFVDFLQKDVYAIPYGQRYSLVTSIDRSRKIGARSGVTGKSAPTYTEKDGKIETCSVTVYKRNGHPEGYTALVYFDEYTTGKNLWQTKPRTMIAKVAEMHALRMACPEELSQDYIEEEFAAERGHGTVLNPEGIATARPSHVPPEEMGKCGKHPLTMTDNDGDCQGCVAEGLAAEENKSGTGEDIV